MDDAVPRFVGLVLAGLIALLGLRAQLGDTPQGERVFKVVLVVFLLVIGFAIYALLRQGGAGVRPDPEAPTTVAGLRRPVASGDGAVAYVDNIAGRSHNRRPRSGEVA